MPDTPKVYTQEEVDKLISERQADIDKKINAAAAAARLEAGKEAEKAKMTADERAKAEVKEQFDKLQSERDALLKENHTAKIKNAVSESGLPPFVSHDERLVSAKDEEIPEVIKAITKEMGDFIKPKYPSTAPMAPNQQAAAEQLKDIFGHPIDSTKGFVPR